MPSDIENLAAQTEPLRAQLQDLQGLADGFGRAMTTAFRRSVVDGKRLEDVLKSLALGLSSRALNQALAPIGQGIGNALSSAARQSGRRRGFAKGGVVGARRDAVRGGRRDREAELLSDARRARPGGRGGAGGDPAADARHRRAARRARAGGGAVNVTFNVTTPDAASFRRAEAELSAMLARAVARGQRGL